MLRFYNYSFNAISFSSVSRTASLCPRASHLDLAVCQSTSSLDKIKVTSDTTDSVPKTRTEKI